MVSSTLPLLIVILILLIIVIILFRYQIKEQAFKIYLYKQEELPLNVYFSNKTMNNSNFKILYSAVSRAIDSINESFNYEFFTLNNNQHKYPNVVQVQIACGYHYGCITGFDGKGGILAHATFPPHRKVCIDCKDIKHENLSLIVMHEFGHIIGLEHTDNTKVKSLMHPYIDDSLKGFTSYDVDRVKEMFKFLK